MAETTPESVIGEAPVEPLVLPPLPPVVVPVPPVVVPVPVVVPAVVPVEPLVLLLLEPPQPMAKTTAEE